MQNRNYSTVENGKKLNLKAISSSRVEKIANEFAHQITGYLSGKIYSAVVQSGIDTAAEFGTNVMTAAWGDLKKSEEEIRSGYHKYSLDKFFGTEKKEKKKKQEEEINFEAEDFIKNAKIATEDSSKKSETIFLPNASFEDLMARADRREWLIESIKNEFNSSPSDKYITKYYEDFIFSKELKPLEDLENFYCKISELKAEREFREEKITKNLFSERESMKKASQKIKSNEYATKKNFFKRRLE